MSTKSLKQEVERLSAAREIENLVNRYEYKLSAGQIDDVPEMFALKTPGVRVEIVFWGVWEGAEGIMRCYDGWHRHVMLADRKSGMVPGSMNLSPNCTPVIEVAEDGKTAKGLWFCPGLGTLPKSTDGKLQALWWWSKRAYDFIKEDGKWKIWHYHVYPVFCCPYDKSWVDVGAWDAWADAAPDADEFKPDKPTTYRWLYSETTPLEYVPPAPEPYRTFDETFSY